MADLRNRMNAAAVSRRRRQGAENFDKPKAEKGVKPLRGIKTEGEEKVRLWNLSDDPSTAGGSKSQALLVLSATVQPGSAVEISAVDFATSKRLQALVKEGRLHKGDKPPAGYLKAKGKLRVSVPRSHTRRTKDGPERKAARAARGELRRATADFDKLNKISPTGEGAQKALQAASVRVRDAADVSRAAREALEKKAVPVPKETADRLSKSVEPETLPTEMPQTEPTLKEESPAEERGRGRPGGRLGGRHSNE